MENGTATITAIGVDRIEEKKETGILNHDDNVDDVETTAATTTTVGSRNRRVRKNLKKSMAKLRGSLAAHEQKFLQGLLETGTDQEIQAATQTILLDPTLFLTSNEHDEKERTALTESEQKNNSKQQEEEGSNSHHHADGASASNFSSSLSSAHSSGSEQRRERLEVRKSFDVYDQLWKAYEEGILADTANSSSSTGNNDGGVVIVVRGSNNSAPAHFRQSAGHHHHRASSSPDHAGLVVGINHCRGASRGGRRLSSSVTAAKVHRLSVTSSLVARKSSNMVGRRKISSNFRASSSAASSSIASTIEQLAKSGDFNTGSSGTPVVAAAAARRKSVKFFDKEDHLSSPKQDDVEEKDGDEKSRRLEIKEIKPCLVKKKPKDGQAHICDSSNEVTLLTRQQQQQQGASNSYCNTNCLPCFQFFTRFRRASISTDVNNDTRVRAMPQIPVKEDDSSIIDIPAGTDVRIGRKRGDSFDETMTFERVGAVLARQRTSSSHGLLKRTFSDDCLHSEIIRSPSHSVKMSEEPNNGNNNDDNNGNVLDYYDAWLSHVQGSDFHASCDNNFTHLESPPSLDFLILGSSANDKRALPHVLSPPLMQSLQAYLPWNKRGENFWLKYSLVRDGACMITLLQACRGTKHSFLAIETIGGDVFGAFCGQPWRKSNGGHYGSAESFIWKMKHARNEETTLRSVFEQAAMEREIEVYPYSHNNDFIQVCKSDRLSVGGGTGDTIDTYTILPDFAEGQKMEYHDWGPAIYLTKTLLQGTSSPCLTFCSPALCPRHADGSLFEIINLEIWALTPAMNLEQAEQVECGQLFFAENSNLFKK